MRQDDVCTFLLYLHIVVALFLDLSQSHLHALLYYYFFQLFIYFLILLVVLEPRNPSSNRSKIAASKRSVAPTARPIHTQRMHKAPRRVNRLVIAQVFRQILIECLTIPPQGGVIRVRRKRFSHIHGETQARPSFAPNIGGRKTAFGGQWFGVRIGLIGDTLIETEAGESRFRDGDVRIGVEEQDVFE